MPDLGPGSSVPALGGPMALGLGHLLPGPWSGVPALVPGKGPIPI